MVHDISRRAVIAGATLVPVAALKAAAPAPQTALSTGQRQTLDAFVDRLVPKDELGPGALEMGAAQYIDLALADALAAEKSAIVEGLEATDALARKRFDAPLAELPPEKKDEVLTALENGDARNFFLRLRRLTLEGMFGDPYYGGNRNFAGWDLIRYPGPRLAVAAEDQMMTPGKPLRHSAYGASAGHGQ